MFRSFSRGVPSSSSLSSSSSYFFVNSAAVHVTTRRNCSSSSSSSSPSSSVPLRTRDRRELAAQQRAELAKAAAEFSAKQQKDQKEQRGGGGEGESPPGVATSKSLSTTASSPSVFDERHRKQEISENKKAYLQKTQQQQQQQQQSEGKTRGSFKVKRKAPWGQQQLRDAWSEDAMARHDKDSVGIRIDREYRYHPEAYLRRWIKWVGWLIPPAIFIAGSVGYYWASGHSVWKIGDFQTILNVFRQLDTSPRSALYLPKTAEKLSTPFALEEDDDETGNRLVGVPRRRRVGAREEYDALVHEYKKMKARADSMGDGGAGRSGSSALEEARKWS